MNEMANRKSEYFCQLKVLARDVMVRFFGAHRAPVGEDGVEKNVLAHRISMRKKGNKNKVVYRGKLELRNGSDLF